jgi:hypothetical protein
MKVYVAGQLLQDDAAFPRDRVKPGEDTALTYSYERGGWLMPYKEAAELELEILTKGKFHVREHYCQFELEEVDGTFAIVCQNHPPLTEGAIA